MDRPIWQMIFQTYVDRITAINNVERDHPYIPRVGESVELNHKTWRVLDIQYNHYKRIVTITCNEEKTK